MILRAGLLLATMTLAIGCSGAPRPLPADFVETRLSAPLDTVKTALTQILTDDGYDVDWKNDSTLETSYREEMQGPWNWLYRWRFGTIKSRVNATVTAADNQNTALKLEVQSEGKDGIFTSWDQVPSALPQSADNQLRLIKNALQLL
ncbi:MAG: conserved exported protein of unknown function [Nitrospira sp.]|nr:MAG: conserved exported protein of unknown function [Nitrospira sp.]